MWLYIAWGLSSSIGCCHAFFLVYSAREGGFFVLADFAQWILDFPISGATKRESAADLFTKISIQSIQEHEITSIAGSDLSQKHSQILGNIHREIVINATARHTNNTAQIAVRAATHKNCTLGISCCCWMPGSVYNPNT